MFDSSAARRESARPPRRLSSAPELGDYVDITDVDLTKVCPARDACPGGHRASTAAGGRTDRRNSAAQPAVHQRHMPIAPLKLTIPRKTKENRGLLSYISTESREYEDMMTVLTSSYMDTNSAGCFTYCKPRLVNNELLEKEFVEKRKEMKTEGRTEKELEESYCFLLADGDKVSALCEKGLQVAQSQMSVLGNPSKGVYLSRYSDLLQKNALTAGATGEIIIFKVMKGKVKSIYENMKILQDPTPRFDSHISKNANKVTALTSFRAFELTQQYFYEYSFDQYEPRQRPRQVCPYAVISFLMKGRDAPVPSMPSAPVRMNNQSAESSKEHTQFTVWSGELVKDHHVLFHVSLLSSSPPFLPHKLPDKLEFGSVMKLEQLNGLLPSGILSYDLYSSSQEVEKDGYFCSLLEMMDKNRSTPSVTTLLQELETKQVVVVIPLTERGFLLLLSSVQMAAPAVLSEQAENWKRCLQALFIFPQTRDVSKYTSCRSSSSSSSNSSSCPNMPAMPHLKQFIPALHHALLKARANPPPELSAGVEQQAQEYLSRLKDSKVRLYPMGQYDSKLDEQPEELPVPKHHRVNMDSYVHCYLNNPAFYLLPVPRARQMTEAHCVAEPPPKTTANTGEQRDWARKQPANSARDKQIKNQKMQQLIDLVLTCKRNAENEVRMEEAAGKKRKLEQETAERALKFLKASQEPGEPERNAGSLAASSSPVSYSSVMGSVGLKDVDLRDEESELASKLFSLLTGLSQAARGSTNQSLLEEAEARPGESWPFDRLAAKLGLPTNCDLDLRKQDELEEQTAGSVSSLEGFSPGSHSGEINHPTAAERGGGGGRAAAGRKAHVYEEEEELIPWILFPITGLSSERYSHRDWNLPQDPRFQQCAVSLGRSPAPSPPASPTPSPPPATSQCPSPSPSPPPSPVASPSHSPEPSSLPSPQRGALPPPSQRQQLPQTDSLPTSSPWAWSLDSTELSSIIKKQSGANEERWAPPTSQELAAQREDMSRESSIHPSNAADPERTRPSPPPAGQVAEEQRTTDPNQTAYGGESEEVEEGEVQDDDEEEKEAVPTTLRKIDDIVDRQLGVFSSEVQLLLQEEKIHCNFPQSPHSASNAESAAPQHTLPYSTVSQFSRFVSFHNPCPPVQDHMKSLLDNIHSIMREFDCGRTSSDSALANKVSAFVASVRASGDNADEPTAADAGASDNQSPAPSGADEVWRPDSSCTRSSFLQVPGAALVPVTGQPQWTPPQSFGITRTVAPNNAETQDGCPGRSGLYGTNGEAGADGTSRFSGPTRTHEQNCSVTPEPAAGPAPPATALSSLISQLQPEVFSNLAEIMKDVKRNSVHFHLHSVEPEDPADEDVKEHLLKQGNVERNPVDFLTEENPESRLLVIIKNKDIAQNVHRIPGLVSLKRHPSVVFVGIDTLDDIRNNSYNELFVSGGCIVSDELTLSPDFISHDRLASLLKVLEEISSPEKVWRWKIHCKTLKKLKEQSRFKRDAANILEVLTTYQKHQLVEVLPYHHCDMTSMQSPDLDCLIQHQARYTQYRHTIFLTEHRFETFPAYPNAGIIVANIEEILNNFSRVVGCHNIKDMEPLVEDLLAFKGLGSALDCSQSPSRPCGPPQAFLRDETPRDDESYLELKDSIPSQVLLGPDGARPCASSVSLSLEPDETRKLNSDLYPPVTVGDSVWTNSQQLWVKDNLMVDGDVQAGSSAPVSLAPEPQSSSIMAVPSSYQRKKGPNVSARRSRDVRIQLYDCRGQRWQDDALTDPNTWQQIVGMRVGFVPGHAPYKKRTPNELVVLINRSTHLATSSVKVEGKPDWLKDVMVSVYSFEDGLWARVEMAGCFPGDLPRTLCYLESEKRDLPNLMKGQKMLNGWGFQWQRPTRKDGDQAKVRLPNLTLVPLSGSRKDLMARPQGNNDQRIQFYDRRGLLWSDSSLQYPRNWLQISFVRAGLVPASSPYILWDTNQLITRLNESTHQTTVGFQKKTKRDELENVIVSIYSHEQGLWARLEAAENYPCALPRTVCCFLSGQRTLLI